MTDMLVASAIRAALRRICKTALDEVGEQTGKAMGERIASSLSNEWQAIRSQIER